MEPIFQTLPPPDADLLKGASLFLDFDGTLVDIVSRHDAVIVEERLARLLRDLKNVLNGRLAIVSGRSVEDLARLLGELGFAAAGGHGAEIRRPDGRVHFAVAPLTLDPDWTPLITRFPKVVIERKPFGFAVHYREAPEAERECQRVAAELAQTHGLGLQSGKMVIELKPKGVDKGSAVARLMSEPPMSQGRPIFVGDDDTDEAGFAMAAKLGGAGVLVGARSVTQAKYQLSSVAKTLAWLERAVGRTA